MKPILVMALFVAALVPSAQEQKQHDEVRIGVLGLFHPKRVVVHRQLGHRLECVIGGQKRVIEDKLDVGLSSAFGNSLRVSCDNGAGSETAFVITIPGKLSREYRGKLAIDVHADELLIVVAMQLETAVASVVAAESPPDAPLEALKAQAVATRSFLIAGKGSHRDFDFCDTTHCQFLRQPPAPGSPASRAAEQTRGLVLTYRDAPFGAMYSASCSGKTHSLEELGIPVHGYPYFAVACDYCRRHPLKWSATLKQQDSASLGSTESSRLKLARKLGWSTVPSNSYEAQQENGSLVLHGVGEGHGIGLCQRGAADMARRGSSFLEILAHYYPNTAVKLLP